MFGFLFGFFDIFHDFFIQIYRIALTPRGKEKRDATISFITVICYFANDCSDNQSNYENIRAKDHRNGGKRTSRKGFDCSGNQIGISRSTRRSIDTRFNFPARSERERAGDYASRAKKQTAIDSRFHL